MKNLTVSMLHSRIIQLLIAATLIIAVRYIVIKSPRSQEPSYEGRSLRAWVIQYGSTEGLAVTEENKAAMQAIRFIGSNGVPFLVNWAINYTPPSWRTNGSSDILFLIPRPLRGDWMFRDEGHTLATGSIDALANMDCDVKEIISSLGRVIKETRWSFSAKDAAFELAHMGSEAVPPLIGFITNNNSAFRCDVLACFYHLGTNAYPAIPVLTTLLDDPDPGVRNEATNAIQHIEAKRKGEPIADHCLRCK